MVNSYRKLGEMAGEMATPPTATSNERQVLNERPQPLQGPGRAAGRRAAVQEMVSVGVLESSDFTKVWHVAWQNES